MSKFGFVFPGQGSQKTGMLGVLAERFPEIELTFAEASDAISLDLWQIVSSDSTGLLDQTHITQPALLAASVAIWRLWLSQGGKRPDLMAGHSLGEYSALVCANVIDLGDAAKIVHNRGKYMQEAVPSGVGAMAAILGLDDEKIIELCRQSAQDEVVAAVNFNSTGQTVIAGNKAAVERAMQACKDAGAKRALPLNVSVPSHCSLMMPAADKLGAELLAIPFRTPAIPIVQNVNGKVAKTPEDIRENLLRQLYMPVQWVDTIACMWDFGLGQIVECGPGKVLCGLIKRIEAEITCYATEDPESFEQALSALTIR